MDVLARIDKLRLERNWTYYKLAEESGVTQSTIANMFARKSTPSVGTLSLFCKAFGISLAEFFCEDGVDKDGDVALLSVYRKLSERDRQTVLALAKHLAEGN